MLKANENLIKHLNSHDTLVCVDLYVLTLKSGSVFYIADYDTDIVYSNHVYSSRLCIMKRNNTKLSGLPNVDSVSVTIYADHEHVDNLDGKYILNAAITGDLDDAVLTIQRGFLLDEAVVGVVTLFNGRCEISSVCGIACNLNVKSEITGLKHLLPERIYAPQNVYVKNESGVVVSSSTDKTTMVIPLKPNSQSVLLRF